MPVRRSRRLQATNGGVLGAIEKKSKIGTRTHRNKSPLKADEKEDRNEMDIVSSPSNYSKHVDKNTNPPSKEEPVNLNASKSSPPSFIIAKTLFSSPSASTAVSELSADYDLSSSPGLTRQRNSDYKDDEEDSFSEFHDEMSGEDEGDDLSFSQNRRENENSSEQENSYSSCSTEENEFESGEESQSENDSETDEDDESEFIVDDDDEDYEIESEEDEDDELEIDSFVDKEYNREKRKAKVSETKNIVTKVGGKIETRNTEAEPSLEETAENQMEQSKNVENIKSNVDEPQQSEKSSFYEESKVQKCERTSIKKKRVICESSDEEDVEKTDITHNISVEKIAKGELSRQQERGKHENISTMNFKESYTEQKCKSISPMLAKAMTESTPRFQEEHDSRINCEVDEPDQESMFDECKSPIMSHDDDLNINSDCVDKMSEKSAGSRDDKTFIDVHSEDQSMTDLPSTSSAVDEEEIEVFAEILSDDSLEHDAVSVVVELLEDTADFSSETGKEACEISSFVEGKDALAGFETQEKKCHSIKRNLPNNISDCDGSYDDDNYESDFETQADDDYHTLAYPYASDNIALLKDSENISAFDIPDGDKQSDQANDDSCHDDNDDATVAYPKDTHSGILSADDEFSFDDDDESFLLPSEATANEGKAEEDPKKIEEQICAVKEIEPLDCCHGKFSIDKDNLDGGFHTLTKGKGETKTNIDTNSAKPLNSVQVDINEGQQAKDSSFCIEEDLDSVQKKILSMNIHEDILSTTVTCQVKTKETTKNKEKKESSIETRDLEETQAMNSSKDSFRKSRNGGAICLSDTRENHVATKQNERTIEAEKNRSIEKTNNEKYGGKAVEIHNAEKNSETVASKENTEKTNIVQPKTSIKKMRRDGSIRKGKWSLGSKIGVGAFGHVHVGLNMQSGHLMAIKIVELSPKVMQDIRMEVDLLKSLKHENIVQYLGAEISCKKLHIFQEWVPGGSVSTLLQKFGTFSTAVMRSYLSQILTGLAYLHANRILHRDIKGGNVLVSDNGIVKLADFGAAKRLEHEQSDMMEHLTLKGTPYFMAPEVFVQKYNSKADIWSVGCVAFQMSTGQPPWRKEGIKNPMALYSHLQNSEGIPSLDWPVDGPVKEPESKKQFESMLNQCFERSALKRPSAQGLLEHSFFSLDTSCDEDSSYSRALFSPGDTLSTFTSKPHLHESITPEKSSKQKATLTPKTPLMSPPLPSKIKMLSSIYVSPLHQSPALNSNDWPSWARDELQRETLSPFMCSKQHSVNDSLALSADSKLSNPFARKVGRRSQGSASSQLAGIQFLDDESLG